MKRRTTLILASAVLAGSLLAAGAQARGGGGGGGHGGGMGGFGGGHIGGLGGAHMGGLGGGHIGDLGVAHVGGLRAGTMAHADHDRFGVRGHRYFGGVYELHGRLDLWATRQFTIGALASVDIEDKNDVMLGLVAGFHFVPFDGHRR